MLGARPLLAPLTRRCAPTPARLRRAPQTPSAKRERSRARPPCSTLLSHQGPPAPGTDPAHVGGERLHVRVGDEVLVGGHLDRLALEEPAADRVLGDARELALGDPGAQLVLAARVLRAAATPRSVAREAPELARQPLPAPRRRLLEREQPDADGWIDEPARLDHQQGDERPRERTAQPGHPVRFHRPPSLDSARCSAIYPPRCV